MNYITKRHIIKIPKNIAMHYCDAKRIIIFTNSFTQKSLILKTKIIIERKKRMIKITREPFFNMSNNRKKRLKARDKEHTETCDGQANILTCTVIKLRLF